jgi:ribonuclease VapC
LTEKKYVLDSYALLNFFENEDGAEKVEILLKDAQAGKCQLYMSVVNLAEVYYSIERREGEEKAVEIYSLIRSFLLTFVEVNLAMALQAAKIKSQYAIALGDCFCAATAKESGASVVTGDPEYEKLGNEVKIMWLPKKTKKTKE